MSENYKISFFSDCIVDSYSYSTCRIAIEEYVPPPGFTPTDLETKFIFYLCMVFFNAETYKDEDGEVLSIVPELTPAGIPWSDVKVQQYSVARDFLTAAVEICFLGRKIRNIEFKAQYVGSLYYLHHCKLYVARNSLTDFRKFG